MSWEPKDVHIPVAWGFRCVCCANSRNGCAGIAPFRKRSAAESPTWEDEKTKG